MEGEEEHEQLEGDALLLAEHEDVPLDLIDFLAKEDEPEQVDLDYLLHLRSSCLEMLEMFAPISLIIEYCVCFLASRKQEAEKEELIPSSAVTKHAYRIGVTGTEAKAGLAGVDKARVNEVIYEMSKGSSFFKNEQRKEAEMQRRIDHMKKRMASGLKDDPAVDMKVEKLVEKLEAERDLSQTMLHVDMDAFYAAVEMRDNPSLIGKPMAVGGMGMLSTSNYEARKYGVRSAMPGFIGKELCPELIIVPPNYEKYKEASKLTRTVYEIFDPNYSMASLDEAYLNITAYLRAHPATRAWSVALEIKDRILALTKLTCSIGIGANKMLAKICTDVKKPDGIFQLANDRDSISKFLGPLSVRKISGIGKVTEKMLQAIGISTCRELLDQRGLIFKIFHDSSARFFLRASMGISSSHIVHRDRKSISTERTFRGLSDPSAILDKCYDIVSKLARTMEDKELVGKNLTVKLKATSFAVKSKSITLQKHTNTAAEMFNTAVELIKSEFPISIRLLGIRMSALKHVDEPDEVPEPGQRRIDQLLQQQQHRKHHTEPPKSMAVQSTDSTECPAIPPPPPIPAPVSIDLTLSPCPICNMDGFTSEQELTQHVENCLSKDSVPANSTAKRPAAAPTSNPPAKKVKAPPPGQRTLMGFLK